MTINHYRLQLTKGLRLFACFSLLSISACSMHDFNRPDINLTEDPIDSEINLTGNGFEKQLRPHSNASKTVEPIIKYDFEDDLTYSPVILAPEDPSLFSAKRVTLSITEDVPVKDVLMELARLSDLELALDPNIDGGIILKVNDRSVKDVIELIVDQADLRYNVENGVLRVQQDGPYLVTYRTDYINLDRSSKSTVNTQTQLLATEGNSSGSSAASGASASSGSSTSSGSQNMNSGSTHEITSVSNGDIWKSIEQNIEKILALHNQDLYKDLDGNHSKNIKKSTASQASSYYTINKQAGIINVMADSKKQKEIKKYLDYVKASVSSQVLIEAKIVEVELNHDYTAGINWNNLTAKGGIVGTFQYAPTNFTNIVSGVISGASQIAKTKNGNLNYVMSLLEGFGTTRTLFNPRINAVNNQQAVLTFATNQPYFTISATLQQTQIASNGATSNTPPTITSTLHSIPIGVILTLQPSINLETQEVTMSIRPTLTVNTGQTVSDPAVQIMNLSLGNSSSSTSSSSSHSTSNQIESLIPVVSVKEIDTILKARSGDVMVIGGLIQHTDGNTEAGLPFFNKIPVLGNLAKQKNKTVSIIETVILIQATIVPNTSNYHPQDRKVYETFIQDSRPLTF